MRIKILQLSDLHCRAKQRAGLQLVNPLVKAVHAHSEGESFTITAVTGDIAFSGTSDEYNTARTIFEGIRSGIGLEQSSQPDWVMVPGNHDCNFELDSAVRSMVMKSVATGTPWDASIPATCLTVQRDFFEFANNTPRVFPVNTTELISQSRVDLGEQSITLWGINSAWTSQIKERPGSIYFPVQVLQQQVEAATPGFNVLLMHHPLAWYQPEVRREFARVIDSAFTIVLAGHEHQPEAWERDDLIGNKTLVVEGGVFQERPDRLIGSTFNLISIDFEDCEIHVISHEFDGKRYVPGVKRTTRFSNSVHTTKQYRLLSEKCSSFINSAGATFRHPRKATALELQDVFVEPDFLDMEAARDAKVPEARISTREILSDIRQQPHIVIGGAEKSGKSAWIRWVFLQLHSDGITPVRIEGTSLRSADVDRIMKAIDNEYRQQYAVTDIVDWQQLDFCSKALLIDDFDTSELNSETRKTVLGALTLRFGIVVMSCDDALLLQASGVSSEFDGFKKYELPEFGHRLRDVLIGKWLRIGQLQTLDAAAFQLQRQQRTQAINSLLGQSFIPSRPIFLLTLLQSMDIGSEAAIRGSSLGEYYEFLIRHALLGARVEARDLDAVLNYLTEMGYHLISGSVNNLNPGELAAFDANFAKRYALPLRFDPLHRQLLESDILEEWNGEMRFKYRYVLLFFGARYLARGFANNAEVQRQVSNVVRNLSNAKCGDLMLFIVHHSNDPAVLDMLLREAEKSFGDLLPLRLDQTDVAPIGGLVSEVPRLALRDEPFEKRREDHLRSRDSSESRKRVGRDDLSDLSLAALQDDEVSETLDYAQLLSYAMRVMGILGQVLRNHYGSLLAERKEEIALKSYALLGRIARSYFDVLGSSRDELVKALAKQLEEKKLHTSEQAEALARKFIFGLASLMTFVLIKRGTEFLGSDKLLLTHEKVAQDVGTPLSRLLELSITLDYPATGSSGAPRAVPVAELKELYEEFDGNPCAAWVLRRLVRDYLHLFEISFRDKQKICDALGIPIISQQQIQNSSQRKKLH